MSLIKLETGVSSERISDLVEHYSKTPGQIQRWRSVFTTLWYAALREPIPGVMNSQKVVRGKAMESAISGVQEKTKKLLALKPLHIHVSPEDLEKIQEADNNMFFVNHQGFKDIPRTCQLLAEILGTHATTHFVMKPSVPAPWIFKMGGGLVLKRGKELKKEKESGKIDTRGHLLRPEELPDFFGEFMKTKGRNIVVYSQGTRAKGKTDEQIIDRAFSFNPKVIDAMNTHVEATPDSDHVVIALDYRGKNEVTATIKALGDDEKQEQLGSSVNAFLAGVKNSK